MILNSMVQESCSISTEFGKNYCYAYYIETTLKPKTREESLELNQQQYLDICIRTSIDNKKGSGRTEVHGMLSDSMVDIPEYDKCHKSCDGLKVHIDTLTTIFSDMNREKTAKERITLPASGS